MAKLIIASFLASFIVSIPAQIVYAPAASALGGTVDSKPNCAPGAGLGGITNSVTALTKAGDGCVLIKYVVSGVTFFETFNYTGADQTWTVPVGVTTASVTMIGAGGGGAPRVPGAAGSNGGSGGFATGNYIFTAGDIYTIIVGQGGGGVLGTSSAGCYYSPLTYGGGGKGGSCYQGGQAGYYASGGGRSAIRASGATEDLATAGGGGGGSYSGAGANGGGTTGSNGGGTGGTQSAGGTGGTSGNGYPGLAGAKYLGGNARDEGGGGGGGYYGGGGGGDNTGGGGGSSFIGNLISASTSALPAAVVLTGATSLVTTTGVSRTFAVDSATGGTGTKSFTYSVSPSAAGVTLDTTTTVNGAYIKVDPTVSAGTYTVTLLAFDQYGMSDQEIITLLVNPPVSETATAYTITTTSGQPIADTVFATGGSSAKAFTLVGSPTNAGITLDTSLASINKSVLKVSSAVVPGTYFETITATDTATSSAYVVITVIVNSKPVLAAFDPGPITMDSGTTTVDTFTTTLGTPGYRYTVTVSPVNAGITLDTSTTDIARLKVAASVPVGIYSATVFVTDTTGATDSETVQINVVYPRVITQPATCTPDAGFTNCIYVGYTGKVQSYALPFYLFPGLPVQIEEWGAGGGGSYYTTGWTGSNGGAAGGYTKATHTIINGGETLTVLVGEGGSSQQAIRTFGGGGAGGNGNGGQTGSNGGGLTGVYFGSDTSTPLLISGGGGGASPGDSGGGYVAGGGGAAGNSGSTGGSTDIAGNSGTLLAGGAAATSYSGCSVPPTSGSRNQGGSGAGGAGVEGGGGGGGGYYGGGGGACQGGQQNGGGGGGSGYVSPSSIQIITATNGGNGTQGYVTPGGNTSTQYKLNAGRGGYYNCGTVACSKAGDGLVVIQWNANLPVISFDSNSATSGISPTSITEVDTITVTLPGNTGTLLKNGFTAVRWNTLANGAGTSYSFGDSLTTTSNVKLYAQYGATLKFDLNGGTGATPSDILRYDTNTFVLPNIDSSTFAFTGLTFTSWNTRADGTGTFYRSGDTVTLTPTGGVQTLYAYWAGPLAATGSTGTTLKTTVTIATSETITALNGTGAKRFALTSSSNMNGGITLDTTTAASGFVVLKVSSSTPVDTYTETVTITDAVGATVRFVVTVRVNNFPTFASGIIQNGLVLHVDAANPLSETGTGSTWYDLSGNGKNFTLAGSPTYTTNSAGALNFDGSTQYAYNATTTTLANFTASVWAKSNIIPPTGSYSPVSAYWNGTNLNYSIYFNGSGTLYGGFNTSNTWYQTSASFAPTPGVWYQYTVSYDGAAVRLYVNGVQLSSFATTATAATGGGVYIGSNWGQGGKWNGSIGNVQVYNRALAATDVFNNFAVNAPHYISGTSGTTTYSLSQSGPTVTPTYTVGQGTDTKTISVSPTIAGLTPTISGNTIFFTLGNGLAAGTYNETITATDSVGAVTNYLATFTVTGSIVESATSTNVILDSVQSFVDTITVNGGVGPYTFTLSSSLASSGITLDTTTAASKYVRLNISSGVAPGTYLETITATDANGISTYILITVTINAPPFLTHPDGQNGVAMTPTNYSNSIIKTGLALQLDFNNTSSYSGTGTTINSLVGTISGSTTNSPVFTATGGGYFTLDGVSGLNKEISTSSGSATTGNISQFAWIYPTADGVITTEYNSNGWIYQNMFILGGKLWVQFYQGTAHTSTLSVPFNQWNYVGYTYDGTTIKSYINGQLAGTSTSTRSAPPSDQWRIGLGYNSLPYGNFRIGSFHVYSTTLSTLDVQKNFVYTEPRFDSVGVTVLQTTAGIPISKSGYVATSGTGNKAIAVSPSVSGASIDTSTVNYATYNLAGSVAVGSVLQRLTATDQVGVNSQYNVLAIVNPAMTLAANALVETTTVGTAIGPDTITVANGTRTYSFALTGSPTTTGFSLNSISETQTSLVVANTVPAGTYYETITVTDSVSATASIVIKVIINGPPVLSASAATINTNFGVAATDTFTVTGGTGPFTFTLTSNPSTLGITLDSALASSGVAAVKFSNTVPVGAYTETVTVTDAKGATSTFAVTIYVNASVAFNINGGSGVTPSAITQTTRSNITLPDGSGFSRSGYTFMGWVESGTVLVLTSPYLPPLNQTLLAQWSPRAYKISYDSNTALSGNPSSLADTYTTGSSSITLPLVGTMVKTGYTFGGWARTRTGPSIGLTETSTTSDETLYAVWTPNPYTITFNSNYGTPSTKTESITAGVEVTLDPNTFARSGYSFSGWDDTSTGTGTDYTDGQAVTFYSNKTMYAQWTLRKPDAPTVTSVTAGNDSVTVTVAPVVQNCSQFISGPGTVVVDTTTAPGYCIYKITAGAETLTVPSGVSNVEVFAVAGGGGGGWGANAGGGGGGGIIYNPSMSVTPGSTLQLKVGAGGAGNGNGNGATGESTTVGTFVAMGGGGGSATSGSAGLLGGSSGGTSGTILNGSACGSNPSRAAGQYSYSGWTTYGNAGGGGCVVGGTLQGGGGGGATSAGTNTGTPGSGLVSAISGTSVTYSAGGRGYGGIQGNSAGSAGSANTGTGGGPAANGGSGYLFLKFVDQTGGTPTGETITALDASGAALSPAKSCYIATGAGSCVITGLTNNTTYKFVSSASNISGSSANSAAVSGTPLPWLVTYSPESGTVSPATDNFNYPFANSLPTPIRAGYTFVGWYDTRTSGTLIGQGGDSYTVTRATTFYARWVPVSYTIRYDSNTASGGTVPSQGSYATGGSAYVIVGNTGSLTKPGYTFGGWNTAANGSGTTYAIGFQDTATINIVLYAQWTPIAYSVTYALNGGSGTTPTQSAVNYQQQFTLASISGITRTGYTFAGWSDSTTTYLAGAIYQAGLSNIVLTAQWTVNKYLVTYDPNGATGRATDTSTLYTYGASALTLTTVGTMVRTGYSFAGWSTTNNGSVISGTYTPTGPITLYAIWSANNYTIVFSSNYGTPSTSNETITAGTPKALNANAFTRSGFIFSNWSVDTSGVGTTYTDSQVVTLFGNLNLYAQWTIAKPDTPTVSAVTAGNESATVTVSSAGTGGAPTSYIVTAQPGGATCSITAPATSCSIAGLTNGTPYTFKAVAINSSGTSGSSTSSSAVTPRPFTVSYNPGDGATSDTSTDYYSVGDPLTLPGATKAGYTLAGWFTASSGGSLIGPSGAAYSPTDSITLYAQWTGIAYTITYNANGADTGTAPASGTYVNGGSAYLIAGNTGTLVRAGYTFVGWNTASSGLGTNYAASASYSTGASLSLYAKWSAAPLSLTYVANGGTGTLPNVATKYVGDSFTVVASNVLTKAGSNFAGWTDGRNTYTGGAVYTMGTRSETLTAVWVGIINTVTYDLNFAGAPANPTEANHAVNDTFTVAAGGTRTGYNFAGWNDGSNTYQAGATYTVGSSNILLTAQWTIKSFTITYDTSTASGGAVTRAADTFAYGSQPISLPQLGTIIKPGYSFAGWATSQGGSPIIGAFTPSASTTLYVVWKANTYTITYDGNSGSAPDTETVLYTSGTGGITLQPQGTMTRFGYTFGGWSTTANGSSPVSNGFAPTIDSTLYAIWNIITSNVTYYIGSGGGSQTATLPAIRSLGYNSTFTVDTFTSTDAGFAFAGWNDGNTTYGPGSTYRMGASSISLTAQWIAIFTVHYTLNGGTPAINDSLEFDGSHINLAPAPTKYGYDFQGWLDQLDPAQPTLAANSAYTVGITHYLLSAVWSAKTIHLTFDTGTTTSITTSYGSTITMPVAPTKAGYLFKNWSGGGSTYGAGASVLIGANDIAFTAQWTPVKYFIYFDLNLGRSDTLIVDIDPIVGETITLTSVAPIRAGYTFLGWSDGVTTPPNGQIYWMPGNIYTQPAGNVTLTAQFSPNSYSVTYLLNGAPGSAPTQSAVLTGGTFALASAPTWTNYSFVGWSDGTNTLAAGSTYTVVADTVTLTAQWVSTLFTASYSLNGGTGTIPATVNLNTGETFTVAAYSGFSKAGYDFAGWSDGSNVRTNPYVITMGTTNIALTAQWTLQVPGKPGNPIITPGNGNASIQVVAPSTGGTPTSYVVTASPGGATCTVVSPATSCVISALTNGTQYSFNAQAINSAGSSTSSNAVTSTPATVSGAPTNVVAVAGNTSATISFTAPASNGGSTITSYTVTASTGQSATGTSSPITISGLTNGTSETFTVTATNGIGTSAPSTASGSVTPATTPGAPSISGASVSGGAATIVFNAPSSNGGSAITSYTVISSPGGLTATGSSSPIVVPGLVTGTPYTFTVVANNAMGAGTPSAPSSTLVSALKPDAPPAPTAVAGNGQATITFAAPASNGGATITSYTVTASPGGETSTVSSGTTATVTGLTNGQAYTFTVTATNAIGTSFSSLASNSVTPIAPSTAPLNVSALAAPGSATISFDTPTSTGGSPITGYIITPSPATSPATFTTTTSPVTIAGLTNGTAYTFTVKAVNAAGQSVASLPSASVTPATTPDTPTAVIATPMDGGASVAFTAPAANGSLINSYTVTASNGATASGVSSPIIFSGLTNGTAYTFVVTATNGVGLSDTSLPSAAITPANIPSAPTISTVTAGLSAATITVVSGGSGGSAITSYVVTAAPGGATCTVYAPADSCTIAPLTPGTSYYFTAVAINAVGQSLPSSASASVTPINVPGTPTSLLAAPSDGAASISFTAPTSNGSPVIEYIATNTSTSETFTATSSPIAVSGLTNGTPTTFSIVAVNAAGASIAASVTTTSRTVAGAPSITGVSGGSGTATISVGAPSSNGGSAITSYIVTASPGGASCVVTSPATSCTISGLINGTTYTFSAAATNAAGTGNSSAPSGGFTPASAPSAPTNVSAVAGAGNATVSFAPPSLNGGSAVTSYTVTSSPSGGSCTVSAPATSCIVSGLTNGIAYTFNVVAANGVGSSSAATTNSVTPLDVPTAPRTPVATPTDGGAVVTFTAPSSNGGATILYYTVTAYPGSITEVVSGTTATFTGLNNGTAYTFDVVATNSEGDSTASVATSAVTPRALAAAPDARFDLTENISYTVDISATGGTNPKVYALPSPAVLPVGMTLDANTGIISGIPTVAGTYVETVTATDATGASVTTVATIQVTASNSQSNNGGGKYLVISPVIPPAAVPAPATGGGGGAPASEPGPVAPIPAEPIPNPEPKPTPAKPVAPSISQQVSQVLATATVIRVPATTPVELPAATGAPAKVMTVASMSGTSLAVIITPTGTPPTSYVITITNSVTGEVKTQNVNGASSTQSIPISGLSPTGIYTVAVVANTASGQALSVAGKVATPAAVTAPYSKLTSAAIISANAATSKITTVFPLSSSVSASLNGVNTSLVSGVLASTSADGTSLAMTILPASKSAAINSYVVMVTDRTTGIVTTQTIPAGSTPSSMALAGLAPGDNYSVAVIASNKDGSQTLVLSNAIKMAGVSAGPAKPGVVVLKQTAGTTDSANSPKIVKVVPKVDAKNRNKATVEIGNLKPGQRIKVTVKGKK